MSLIISIVSDFERGLSSALSLTWDNSLRTAARLRSSSVLQFWLHRPLIICVIEDCSNTVISKARRSQTCLRFLVNVQSFAVIIFVIDAVVWHLLFIASSANLVKRETNICLSQSCGDKHRNIEQCVRYGKRHIIWLYSWDGHENSSRAYTSCQNGENGKWPLINIIYSHFLCGC